MGWNFREFLCVKSNLIWSVRLLLTGSYMQNKLGKQDVLVAPPIILLGEQLLWFVHFIFKVFSTLLW